ncbi:MAG: diaminopimelate epimerase [Desulfobacteraceae bacterium]|jgi:diaminopimelate epimerase|nr:diaminopimelate epimerase [Desulfobacteraceae bacterium]
MNPIPFTKMSGTGNDFIIIDNRAQVVADNGLTEFIRKVCRRKMSVGADGFILIESSDKADFRWRFFNSDGSLAEMCGNGARCAARFAYLNGIAGENLSFETQAGIINGQVKGNGAKVKIPDPADLHLDYTIELEKGPLTVSSLNTGVPHVVVVEDSVEEVDVVGLGREIRCHEAFAPAGTNVNFICPQKPGQLAIRTYERGVEDETLACGTGAIASALIASCKKNWTSPISLVTRSEELLTIHFRESDRVFTDVYLEGDAKLIYTAELGEDAWKS